MTNPDQQQWSLHLAKSESAQQQEQTTTSRLVDLTDLSQSTPVHLSRFHGPNSIPGEQNKSLRK